MNVCNQVKQLIEIISTEKNTGNCNKWVLWNKLSEQFKIFINDMIHDTPSVFLKLYPKLCFFGSKLPKQSWQKKLMICFHLLQLMSGPL